MDYRVLVDENTSPRVAESQRGKGITAEHVHEALSEGVDDDTIAAFARENGSVALTHDPDFLDPSERNTSKTCCVCGREDDNQRVERGLYVCKECDAAFNADVNGAENIRLDLNQSNSESSASLDEDRSTGWLAQPGVYVHDLSSGFQPQAQVVDSKP